MTRTPFLGSLAMALVVLASNILVQFRFGDWLTWGAFTYPLAFLVNDIVNRLHGPAAARRVVLAGFAMGLICSAIGTQISNDAGPLVTWRIAIASGTAFLLGQLLDVTLFDRLRTMSWWRAPLISTLLGSTLDTAVFFTLAFSLSLRFLEPGNDVSWAAVALPLLGWGPVVPLWVSLAAADWGVKMAIGLLALVPFRIIVGKMLARVA